MKGANNWLQYMREAVKAGRQWSRVPQQSLVELRVEGVCAIEECRRFQRQSWME